MASTEHFKSITAEISALQNRVRHLIYNAHWPTDGEWKESVVRTFLRRHLPKQFGVGRGFILADADTSTQADVLIYDTNKPILHQDGELVILTSDAARGIIEVKTKITSVTLPETLEKVADNIEFVNKRHGYGGCFHGLFSYEWGGTMNVNEVLTKIRDVARGSEHRRLNCACLGHSHFFRYWGQPRSTEDVWRAYKLDEMSPAYFLHNVFEHLCSESVLTNNSLWFPPQGKDHHQVGEVAFNRTR